MRKSLKIMKLVRYMGYTPHPYMGKPEFEELLKEIDKIMNS